MRYLTSWISHPQIVSTKLKKNKHTQRVDSPFPSAHGDETQQKFQLLGFKPLIDSCGKLLNVTGPFLAFLMSTRYTGFSDMGSQREERQKCWSTRDAYFTCLDVLGVITPGEEIASKKCNTEKKAYEKTCAKSWVCITWSRLQVRSTHDVWRHETRCAG